ncbi:MAG: YdcF family protein [Fibrobacter sp.]|nr:YdcF family protein [Fibrobacter sp.]
MALLIKFIAIGIYPLGLSVFLGITGIVLSFLKKKTAPFFLVASMGILLFFSLPIVSNILIGTLEKKYPSPVTLPGDCSAIVVLGGGGGGGGSPKFPYPEINDAGDRLIHGARLYKSGYCGVIITSGNIPVGAFSASITEGEHNARLLKEFGVDSNAIIIDPKSRNTSEHPRYIGAILDSLKLPKRIILVTSASHMPRSVLVFKKYGFTVFPASADFRCNEKILNSFQDLLPNAHAIFLSTAAMHEYYGILGYKILRWL